MSFFGAVPATTLETTPENVLSACAVDGLSRTEAFNDFKLVTIDCEMPCARVMLGNVSTVLRQMMTSTMSSAGIRSQSSENGGQEDSKEALPSVRVDDTLQQLAPIFELAYGGIHFQVNSHNVQATLWCHDKYDCPALHVAGQQYLEYHVAHLKPYLAISTLRLAGQYGTAVQRAACVDWVAANMSLVMALPPSNGSIFDSLSGEIKTELIVALHQAQSKAKSPAAAPPGKQYSAFHSGFGAVPAAAPPSPPLSAPLFGAPCGANHLRMPAHEKPIILDGTFGFTVMQPPKAM